MGGLIVVEGLDGAGKRTLSAGLVEAWRAEGARVATLAFPRYGRSIHADLGAEALRGQHGDTASSVEAMALLWALDRRDAADELFETVRTELENDPDNWVRWYRLARAYDYAGDRSRARETMKKAVQMEEASR